MMHLRAVPSRLRTPANNKPYGRLKTIQPSATYRKGWVLVCVPTVSNPTTTPGKLTSGPDPESNHNSEYDNMKGSLGKIMQQAQEMQGKMQEAQAELAQMEIVGESGAGLVKVTMNGKHEVRDVVIDPSVFDEDRELLEDLMAAAINDAVQRVNTKSQERMSELTGGLNLPAGMNLPFRTHGGVFPITHPVDRSPARAAGCGCKDRAAHGLSPAAAG